MHCRKWAVEISKSHEGELTEAGEATLRRHLEKCPNCQNLEKRLRAVSAFLNESPELPVPEFLSQRISAVVSERIRLHSEAGVWSRIKLLSYRYSTVFMAAILVIGLCIGGLAGNNIAGFAEVAPAKPSYDLLTLGGIGPRGEPVAFNAIWQDNAERGRP